MKLFSFTAPVAIIQPLVVQPTGGWRFTVQPVLNRYTVYPQPMRFSSTG